MRNARDVSNYGSLCLSTSVFFIFGFLVTDAFVGRPSFVTPKTNTFVTTRTFSFQESPASRSRQCPTLLLTTKPNGSGGSGSAGGRTLTRIPPDLEGVPIPFVDTTSNSFIECYADSVATVDDTDYTIAVPCDHSVALCYTDADGQLIPVELDDDLMDDVYPMAESIVEEEFGDELVLQRTPQTLTLVGELEDEEDEMLDRYDEDDNDEEDDDDDEEEVEVLLSFDYRGKQFHLVRLLDPILLVGKNAGDDSDDTRVLLTPEESERVMPVLEEMLLEFHDDPDAMLP